MIEQQFLVVRIAGKVERFSVACEFVCRQRLPERRDDCLCRGCEQIGLPATLSSRESLVSQLRLCQALPLGLLQSNRIIKQHETYLFAVQRLSSPCKCDLAPESCMKHETGFQFHQANPVVDPGVISFYLCYCLTQSHGSIFWDSTQHAAPRGLEFRLCSIYYISIKIYASATSRSRLTCKRSGLEDRKSYQQEGFPRHVRHFQRVPETCLPIRTLRY